MIAYAVLFALHAIVVSPPPDTVRRSGDTLFIEPLGARFTVPPLWMGRGADSEKALPFGRRRFGCQIDAASGPLDGRIVIDPARFPLLDQGVFGERRSYQDALDAVVPRATMIVHVGGDRFNSNCIAPQVHVYLVDTAGAQPATYGTLAQRVVEREYKGVDRTEADSAGWHTVRIRWREDKTDFLHPATLEIWSRQVGGRILILGVMDGWAANGDTDRLLASVRWS